MKIISVKQMRYLDSTTIKSGTPSEVLMERAGEGAFCEIIAFLGKFNSLHKKKILIITGKGNNAGDGYVIARLFAERTKYPIEVYSLHAKSELKDDARLNAYRLPSKVIFSNTNSFPKIEKGTIIIDCLLGTGFLGKLRSPYDKLIKYVNDYSNLVISIDIPSGLNGDSGLPNESLAIIADLTLTMALPKKGLFNSTSIEHCGIIRTIDIGIDSKLIEDINSFDQAIFENDIKSTLLRRLQNSHKGTFGTVNIIGACRKYVGAPILSAIASLKSGAGYSRLIIPESILKNAYIPLNSIILNPLRDDGEGYFNKNSAAALDENMLKNSAIVFGPGIGHSNSVSHILKKVYNTSAALVLDADGIRVAVDSMKSLKRPSGLTVISPHPGEMKYILQKTALDKLLNASREEIASNVAKKFGIYVVLKGKYSVIANPAGDYVFNSSGNHSLATAGSGDVLAGLIASFILNVKDTFLAIQSAVYLHGRASEIATSGARGLIADELPDFIRNAMLEISPFA